MTYPLPEKLIREFASKVDRILVVEELDPFIEEHIKAMGIKVEGKKYLSRVTGELNTDIIETAGRKMGLIKATAAQEKPPVTTELAKRPPLLCPGCPHSGLFYVLARYGTTSQITRR